MSRWPFGGRELWAFLAPLKSFTRTIRIRGPALEIFLWSRAAIWAAVLFAWLVFEPFPRADRWDDPSLTRDLGWVTDVWARWDSVWFLRIAEHGYGAAHGAAAAFYPLYPLTLAGVGRVLGGHYVLAGIVVSLAATLGSFALLYRLAEPRLGADGARRAVLYLAVSPTALFLQAVYSAVHSSSYSSSPRSCSPSAAAGSAPAQPPA